MTEKERAAQDIVLDVREDLREGREPFQKIMSAAGSVPVGSRLVLYATFKPTPLLAVLQGQGFESEATPIENGEWRVTFHRTATDADRAGDGDESKPNATDDSEESEPSDLILDNRGLEPPEPMVRTLEAINQLAPGGRIVGHYDRRPMFLLPKLDQMGYRYEVTQMDDGTATLLITSPVSP